MKCSNDCHLGKKTLFFGFITLLIASFSYIFLDKLVSIGIHDSDAFAGSIATFGNIFTAAFEPKIWVVVGFLATVLCIYKYIKNGDVSDKLYTFSLTMIMTTIIITILKVVVARYRPEVLIQSDQYGFHWFSMKKLYNSMPSGHTALSFAGLLAIANFFTKKWVTIVAIVLATLIAISRVLVLDHYLSDVIVAAYIGSFTFLWSKAFVESKTRF